MEEHTGTKLTEAEVSSAIAAGRSRLEEIIDRVDGNIVSDVSVDFAPKAIHISAIATRLDPPCPPKVYADGSELPYRDFVYVVARSDGTIASERMTALYPSLKSPGR